MSKLRWHWWDRFFFDAWWLAYVPMWLRYHGPLRRYYWQAEEMEEIERGVERLKKIAEDFE